MSTPDGFVWFAFGGAAVAAVAVALIGGRGNEAGPARLALTGAAVTAGLSAVTFLILNTNSYALDVYRYWAAGGLSTRGLDAVALVLPALVVGAVLALASARGLDLFARCGHRRRPRARRRPQSRARHRRDRAPVRRGDRDRRPDRLPRAARPARAACRRRGQLRATPASRMLTAGLLLLADVVGRVVAPPGEVQAGIVVAIIGAPS
jgi:iron complex transport system permease protein